MHSDYTATLAEVKHYVSDELNSLVRGLSVYDADSGKHSYGVAEKCVQLGFGEYGSIAELVGLYNRGLGHDVGKILVEKDILCKPGKLTPQEKEVMRQHSIYGHDILTELGLHDVAFYAKNHHNDDLVGVSHDLDILVTADHWDALREARCYKTSYPTHIVAEKMNHRLPNNAYLNNKAMHLQTMADYHG